jgi:Flp pilus assembly protein TadB
MPSAGETGKEPSGWTVDTGMAHMQRQLDEMRRLLDERYATQTKAVDAAFVAQQTAMQTALTAAERAVATALLAAEKAVNKAEAAAERRFESVNEFRSQLADQAATFMPRNESDVRWASLERQIAENTKRLDQTQGRTSGMDKAWGFVVAAVVAVGGVVGIVGTIIASR